MIIFLIAFFVILLLIFIIKLKFQIGYVEQTGFEVNLKILFFKLKIFPKNGKIKNRKKIVKKSNHQFNEKKPKKVKKKKSFLSVLKTIKMFLKPFPRLVKMILKRIKIKKLFVDWCVCEENAFKTAIKFGGCSAVFYGILRIFQRNGFVEIKSVKIYPRYDVEKGSCNVSLILQISIFWLFFAILTYIFGIIKINCANQK